MCKPNQVGGGYEKCVCKKGFVRNPKDPRGDCIAADQNADPAGGRTFPFLPSERPPYRLACANVRCPGECVVEKGRPVCKSVPTPESMSYFFSFTAEGFKLQKPVAA